MERLTKWENGNAYYPRCFEKPCYGGGCKLKDCPFETAICERLAAYEDTGMMPDEVAEYKKFEDEVVASGKTFAQLVELLEADKEGRVVILPCKRGGKIYAPRKRGIDTYEVIAIAEDEKGVQLLGKCKCSEESWVTDVFNACDFGKNVFLTREEAERAMEG